MAYVILCEEEGVATPYVLADGATTLEHAQSIMAARAEEYIDEQTEIAASELAELGELVIDLDESKTITRIYPVVDGKRRADVLTMTLSAVEIHG